jgi:hypothetical protein
MAQAEFFPSGALQNIVAELAEWLPASELPTTDMIIAAVPLRIWDLTAGASLREATEATSEWHHQLHYRGHPFGFVRSRLAGDHAQLAELAQSSLAEAVESAFRTLRGELADGVVLKLLRILKNHTWCLWLERPNGADELVVLQSPIWDKGLRVDEPTFFRMVNALPGSGLVISRSLPRHDVETWSRQRWPTARNRPVRQVEGT